MCYYHPGLVLLGRHHSYVLCQLCLSFGKSKHFTNDPFIKLIIFFYQWDNHFQITQILSLLWSLGQDPQYNQSRLDYSWQTNTYPKHQKHSGLKKYMCVDIFFKSSWENHNFVGFGHSYFVTYLCFQLHRMWRTTLGWRWDTVIFLALKVFQRSQSSPDDALFSLVALLFAIGISFLETSLRRVLRHCNELDSSFTAGGHHLSL